MYNKKDIKGTCGVWSVDETIAQKGFYSMTRELKKLAQKKACKI